MLLKKQVQPLSEAFAWLLHKGVTAPIACVSQEFHLDHAVAALDVTLDHNNARLLEES